MRRPLCVFCAAVLLMQMICVYMSLELLLILATFFVIGCLAWFAVTRQPYALCIALGILCGGLLFYGNEAQNLAKIKPYLEEAVTLTARVESPYASYIEDTVSATLQVSSVNGEAVQFACYVPLMDEVEEGALIEGRFLLASLSEETDKLSNYSNGVFAQATYVSDFSVLGSVGGWRAFFMEMQETLSRIIRKPFAKNVGGVLAAMTVGDRTYVSSDITALYRKAGLSHVLVVSGLHLSLICGIVMVRADTRRGRLVKAILTIGLAVFLAGITGGSASILRAVLVLALCTLAELINEQADSFTSLGIAGVLLVLGNGYLVCNLSFQLSFLSTFGVLLGGVLVKDTLPYFAKLREWRLLKRVKDTLPSFAKLGVKRLFKVLYSSVVITLFASAATIPVLVLWDMNISVLSLLSNILTFWMIPFILLFGFVGALLGLIPFLGLISTLCLTSAAILVALLNKTVAQVAQLPGAQLYFETEYAVFVCLAVFALGAIAFALKVRYRVVIPALAAVLIAGIALGNYYASGMIKVAMLGTSSSPAVVISQDQAAMVLFRGGVYNAQVVQSYLDKRNITDLQLVIDMRMSPASECVLVAEETISLFDTAPFAESFFAFGVVQGTIYNASSGGVVVLNCGGITLASTTGTVVLSDDFHVDVLLAASSVSNAVVGDIVLCKKTQYALDGGYAPDVVYYAEDTARLWLRYGGEYKLVGVENGE